MIISVFNRTRVAIALMFITLCALVTVAHAADMTLTATQTTANVSNVNTQTLTSATSTTNVAEVKATRTLTVGSAPLTTQNFTIGNCLVTFATTTAGSGPTEDTDCVGGATVRTTTSTASDTPRTVNQIAAVLLTLTNATSTSHGNLAVSASSTSSSSIVFTTAGTEASSTVITYTPGTASGITSTNSVTGVVAVAQLLRVTPANVETGDTFRTIINGTTISFTATGATVANVTAGLTSAINASAQASAVTATDEGTTTAIVSDAAGTAFTLVATTTNPTQAAQVVTFTPADVENADLTVTINAVGYKTHVAAGATVAEATQALQGALAAASDVTCTEDGTKVTCTANVPGTPFTYSTLVEITGNGGSSSHGRSGSGGGSSSHSSSGGTTTTTGTTVTTTTAVPATGGTTTTTTTTSGGMTVSIAAFSNLTVGVTSANVTALQTWLIAKGYSIPAGATGYFGAQTKAALAAFQKASGISPAVGYFGPLTRAYIASHY